jgi:oligopeptide transport system ATP-binding protein
MTSLLDVEDLAVTIPVRSPVLRRRIASIHALRGVSFSVSAGETLALVGESGSGKSTAARAIVRLVQATHGSISFNGQSVLEARGSVLHAIRRNLQIVFQDPYSSLNRRMSVGDIIGEPLRAHTVGDAASRRRRVGELLAQVGLDASALVQYPVAFSGGQRQRIAIARALALSPRLVVCDEAVSALDVSIQAQILNLLQDLKRIYGLAYLFITHDLGVVRRFADRVAVMHAGRIVEIATPEALFAGALHPYTYALLSAVPRISIGEPSPTRIRLVSPAPSPMSTPAGCLFVKRCAHAVARCVAEAPAMRTQPDGRQVACHLVEKGQPMWVSADRSIKE